MIGHSSGHPNKEGPNRRHVVEAIAIGSAVSSAVGSTALAKQPATLAADYSRDPTRWGSAEIAALFPGFQQVVAPGNRAPQRLLSLREIA